MPNPQQRLIDALRDAGLSHVECATRAGMSVGNLRELLYGRRQPSEADARLLAPALRTTPEAVWELCDPRPISPTPAKLACVQANLRPTDIARDLGLTGPNTVARALNGRRVPPQRLVDYLTERLELPVELLFPELAAQECAVLGGGES